MKKLFPRIRKPIRIDEVSALILASLLSMTAMSLYEESIIRNLAICIILSFVTFIVCAFVNRKRPAGFFVITEVAFAIVLFFEVTNYKQSSTF